MNYFYYFLIAFIVSAFIQWLVVWLQKRFVRYTPWLSRLGGVGMIIGFVGSVWANPQLVITLPIFAIIGGTVMILMFGILDDKENYSWHWQLSFQLVLGALLIGANVEIPFLSNPWGGVIPFHFAVVSVAGISVSLVSSLLVVGWTVGIMNAVNWADGIDGLAGAIGLACMVAIALTSQRPEVNQPAIFILGLISFGAILGFWVWNIHPAIIEAGTSGSYFIGWMIACLAIIAGTKIATTLLVIAIPLLDAGWVIGERIVEKKPITARDERSRHLHYRLRALGWSDTAIVGVYGSVLLCMIGLQYFFDRPKEKIGLMITIGTLGLGVLWYARKKVHSLSNR